MKHGPRFLRRNERRHTHQAAHAHMGQSFRKGNDLGKIIGRKSRLRLFTGNIEFQKHILHFFDFGRAAGNFRENFIRIPRLNQIRDCDRFFHFIFLQMSQKMPAHRKRPGTFAPLFFHFLHAIFPDDRDAQLYRFFHGGKRMKLRHRDKRHRLPVRRTRPRRGNSLPHGRQLIFYIRHTFHFPKTHSETKRIMK